MDNVYCRNNNKCYCRCNCFANLSQSGVEIMKKIFLGFVLLGAAAIIAADRHTVIDVSQPDSDSPTRRRNQAALLQARASSTSHQDTQSGIQRPRTGCTTRRMYQCTCACAVTFFILTAVSLATTPSMRNLLAGRPL